MVYAFVEIVVACRIDIIWKGIVTAFEARVTLHVRVSRRKAHLMPTGHHHDSRAPILFEQLPSQVNLLWCIPQDLHDRVSFQSHITFTLRSLSRTRFLLIATLSRLVRHWAPHPLLRANARFEARRLYADVDLLCKLGLGEVEVARLSFDTATYLCMTALSNAKDQLVEDRMFAIGGARKRSNALQRETDLLR
jgi:hypothetical protein